MHNESSRVKIVEYLEIYKFCENTKQITK